MNDISHSLHFRPSLLRRAYIFTTFSIVVGKQSLLHKPTIDTLLLFTLDNFSLQ
jgi:hypothetical protein